MAEPNIERVKADLHQLQHTLGISPSQDDPLAHALVAASGLASLAWTALAPARWHFLGLLSILVPVAYLIVLRFKQRASVGGSPLARREFVDGVGVLALAIPIVIYTLWAQYLGITPLLVLATVMFFVGVMMVGGAAQPSVLLCWGLAIMAGGLLIPLKLVSPVAAIALALIAGGSISALIVRRQTAALP
jgi:hypothetical protein